MDAADEYDGRAEDEDGEDDEHLRSDEMKQTAKQTEADLAARVTAWLQEQHWKVYPEVRPQLGGPRADIVATQAGRIWIIECKMSYSLPVIAQACNWAGSAHWISVATPKKWQQRMAEARLKREIMQWKGIGHIEVSGDVRNQVAPRLNRSARTESIALCLHDATIAMGVSGSQNSYYTPYRATCRQLLEYVLDNPGCTMKDAIGHVKHHYNCDTTAISCLNKWIRLGKVPGVCQKRDGRRITLHPVEKKV